MEQVEKVSSESTAGEQLIVEDGGRNIKEPRRKNAKDLKMGGDI